MNGLKRTKANVRSARNLHAARANFPRFGESANRRWVRQRRPDFWQTPSVALAVEVSSASLYGGAARGKTFEGHRWCVGCEKRIVTCAARVPRASALALKFAITKQNAFTGMHLLPGRTSASCRGGCRVRKTSTLPLSWNTKPGWAGMNPTRPRADTAHLGQGARYLKSSQNSESDDLEPPVARPTGGSRSFAAIKRPLSDLLFRQVIIELISRMRVQSSRILPNARNEREVTTLGRRGRKEGKSGEAMASIDFIKYR
jgi:hypothetical protein